MYLDILTYILQVNGFPAGTDELRFETLEPIYNPNTVSKVEPCVSKERSPVVGARQTYQIECPPSLPACKGSPVSKHGDAAR